MTEQEYNLAEGIRRSDLWLMNESPEKFKYNLDHPVSEDEKSQAFLFGSACHKMVLEPLEFNKEYAVAPNVDRRTKAGKEEYAQFCESNAGKTVISLEDRDTIVAMCNVLLDNRLSEEMITGQHEVPYFWKDPETGERCKCRADVVKQVDGKYVVVDYKTTTSAQTDRFNAELFRYGYHVQAAMYTEGLQCALKLDYRPKFCFVAQEKKAPYAVNVIEVSDDVMRYGDRLYHDLLRRYHECKELDVWPGYCSDGIPNETQLPGWLNFAEEEM